MIYFFVFSCEFEPTLNKSLDNQNNNVGTVQPITNFDEESLVQLKAFLNELKVIFFIKFLALLSQNNHFVIIPVKSIRFG